MHLLSNPLIYAASLLVTATALALPQVTVQSAPVRVPVIDLHLTRFDLSSRNAGLSKLTRGGVTGVVFPLPTAFSESAPADSLAAAYFHYKNLLTATPKFQAEGCRTQTGRIGTWLSAEAPDELARSTSEVGLWVLRGVRVFPLVVDHDSALATAATTPTATLGLSAAGRDFVEQVAKAGALIDVSGASERALAEAVDIAQRLGAPVIASHADARALVDRPWNLTDEQVRRVAQTGGVIGVTFDGRALASGQDPDLHLAVRHVLRLITVAGEDHVAIGSGFGSPAPLPHRLESAADLPRLAAALLDAHLTPAVLAKVFNGNARRVLCARSTPPG